MLKGVPTGSCGPGVRAGGCIKRLAEHTQRAKKLITGFHSITKWIRPQKQIPECLPVPVGEPALAHVLGAVVQGAVVQDASVLAESLEVPGIVVARIVVKVGAGQIDACGQGYAGGKADTEQAGSGDTLSDPSCFDCRSNFVDE